MTKRDIQTAIAECELIQTAIDRRVKPRLETEGSASDRNQVSSITHLLGRLTNQVITDLERKGRFVASEDGWKRSTIGTQPALLRPTSQSGLRTNPSDPLRRKREHGYNDTTTVERPVEAEVVAADFVGKAIRSIFDELAEMADLALALGGEWVTDVRPTLSRMAAKATTVRRAFDFTEHVRTKAAGRQTSLAGECQACGRIVYGTAKDDRIGTKEDRLRAGYCHECREAWRVAGRPDRLLWEHRRRAQLEQKSGGLLDCQTTAV